jgi:hypothetical protein
MSTHTVHHPMVRRQPGEAATARRAVNVPAIVIICALAVLVATALLVAGPTPGQVRHIGHAAVVASSGGAAVVASSDTVTARSASDTVPAGSYRATLHSRALSAGKAPLSAAARPKANGQ